VVLYDWGPRMQGPGGAARLGRGEGELEAADVLLAPPLGGDELEHALGGIDDHQAQGIGGKTLAEGRERCCTDLLERDHAEEAVGKTGGGFLLLPSLRLRSRLELLQAEDHGVAPAHDLPELVVGHGLLRDVLPLGLSGLRSPIGSGERLERAEDAAVEEDPQGKDEDAVVEEKREEPPQEGPPVHSPGEGGLQEGDGGGCQERRHGPVEQELPPQRAWAAAYLHPRPQVGRSAGGVPPARAPGRRPHRRQGFAPPEGSPPPMPPGSPCQCSWCCALPLHQRARLGQDQELTDASEGR
jgi:hypothetical protein